MTILNHASLLVGSRDLANGCGKSIYPTSIFHVACELCGYDSNCDSPAYYCSDACKTTYAQKLHDEAGLKVQCETCQGTGKVSKTVICGECTDGFNDCDECKGTGKVMHKACSGNGYTIENNNCGHEGANGPHYYCTEHGLNVKQYH